MAFAVAEAMIKKILLSFRSCILCSHLGVTTLSCVLCADCENELLKKKIIFAYKPNWPALSLLEWRPDTEGVGRLIHALKGAGASLRFYFLAQILARQILPMIEEHRFKRMIFIPAPARERSQPDHAELFAVELAKCFRGEVRSCLERCSNEEQKGLSREERQLTQLKLTDGGDPKILENSPIFFVDDIIVSGGTAQAAFEALKKPKYFTVLTLATRPRLQKLQKIVINSDA